MALIKCPECGKEISDKAKSCPCCGYPMKDYLHETKGNEQKDTLNLNESKKKISTLTKSKKVLIPVIILTISVLVIIIL